MKTNYKKTIAILLVAVLSLSMVKFTFAFSKMDVCNYTNWDHSGDYYDRICTKDWKPAENEYLYQKELEARKKAELAMQAKMKEQEAKIHELKHIKNVYNGSILSRSSSYIENNKKVAELEKEISALKINISQKDKLLQAYKNQVVYLTNENKKLRTKNIQLQNFINTFEQVFKNSNSQTIIDEKAKKEAIKEKIRRRIIERNKRILGRG